VSRGAKHLSTSEPGTNLQQISVLHVCLWAQLMHGPRWPAPYRVQRMKFCREAPKQLSGLSVCLPEIDDMAPWEGGGRGGLSFKKRGREGRTDMQKD
jgi:hypothetical protein